jgi:hypothetical protein
MSSYWENVDTSDWRRRQQNNASNYWTKALTRETAARTIQKYGRRYNQRNTIGKLRAEKAARATSRRRVGWGTYGNHRKTNYGEQLFKWRHDNIPQITVTRFMRDKARPRLKALARKRGLYLQKNKLRAATPMTWRTRRGYHTTDEAYNAYFNEQRRYRASIEGRSKWGREYEATLRDQDNRYQAKLGKKAATSRAPVSDVIDRVAPQQNLREVFDRLAETAPDMVTDARLGDSKRKAVAWNNDTREKKLTISDETEEVTVGNLENITEALAGDGAWADDPEVDRMLNEDNL